MSENKPSGGGSKIIMIVLVLIIIGLGVWIGMLQKQIGEKDQNIATKDKEIETTTAEKDQVSKQLEDKIASLEALQAEYEELGIENEELGGQINSLKGSLSTWKNKASASDKEKTKLRHKLEKVLAEAELQRLAMEEEVERYKLLSDSLATEVNHLVEERGIIYDNLNSLEEKVEIASILKAENSGVTIITSKGKELVKEIYKAKLIDKVKVTCNLADNKVAKKDAKEMILRIIDPSGAVLFDLATGGGSFADSEGRTNFYTKKKELLFDNSKQEVTFLYSKGAEYTPGVHKVELFAEGYKIGESSFEVK